MEVVCKVSGLTSYSTPIQSLLKDHGELGPLQLKRLVREDLSGRNNTNHSAGYLHKNFTRRRLLLSREKQEEGRVSL